MGGKRGWRKPVFIGCGLALVPALAVAVLLVLHWSTLARVYHRAADALAELNAVRGAVEGRYGGAVNIVAKHQGGVPGAMLSITLVNPSFLDGLDTQGAAGRDKALEIAAVARDALRDPRGYPRYEVVLARQRGVGVTVGSNWIFRFEASELPPLAGRPAESPTAPSR